MAVYGKQSRSFSHQFHLQTFYTCFPRFRLREYLSSPCCSVIQSRKQLPFFSFPLLFAFYFLFCRECEGRSQPNSPLGPSLRIFGLTTLPLVINYELLGWAKKAQELKVLVTSVRTGHACNFQDMWKWKSARPTTNRTAGYVPVCQACTIQMK